MSRPLTQLLPPELPAGASPQFGAGNPSVTTPNGHPNSMASLKSLLQLPIKADHRGKDCCEIKDKEKPLDSDEDSQGVGGVGGNGAGSSVRPATQSAFLGPLLWERTLPGDTGLFQLQYMDLEEFLTENGMGCMPAGGPGGSGSSASAQIPSQSSQSAVPSQSSQCTSSAVSPPPCSSSSSSSSMSSSSSSSSLLGLDVPPPPPPPPQGMLGGPECLHGGQAVPPEPSSSSSSSCPPPPGQSNNANDVMVNFDPDPADLALSSVPGQEAFDPRRHRFTDDELKPQPMIKKARKMLVPDEQKDEKYWCRRVKNNEAAKRSRDARRLKENQISVRASFLERENGALRQEVADMRKELGRCRNILSKYESRHGDL
ncbi:D site albumin promoter binding protein a [Clupea harengus]|uniref:D site albumin promoter binding protein a n=1 Tax=Clupea harengus TaxID=7950 RepID=A0A6P3VZL1_CLUHA|nr:D site albumin promoter binding protein a [Clupea harengus]